MSAVNDNAGARRVWFITGISSGLGRAIATAALATGDRVVGTVRRDGDGDGIAADDEAAKRLLVCKVDVTQAEQITAAVDMAVAQFGTIDVLVNNAGYTLFAGVEEATDDEIHHEFETNTFGAFRTVRAVLPIMRANRRGYIVTLSSVAAIATAPGMGYYGASKHAIEGFTEALAAEVSALGIKVTAVQPGMFRTKTLGTSMHQATPLEDYADSVGQFRAALSSADGQQPGDPAGLAAVVLRLVDVPAPPLYLAIDPGATEHIESRLQRRLTELAEWSKWATTGTR